MTLSFRRTAPKFRPNRRFDRSLRLQLEVLEERALLSGSPYVVTSLADDGSSGTLRYEIEQANLIDTGTSSTPDLIEFNVASPGSIELTSPLPALTDIAVVDATTATGYDGTPLIVLDGTNAGANANGLTISGGSTTVKGFDIVHFSGNGIQLDTNGGDTILNNYIGITTGNTAAPNLGDGIAVVNTSSNTIGGTNSTDANIISGNGGDGISIEGVNALDNVVVANFIGTNSTGTSAVSNVGNGIQISNGARLNTIGGNTPTATAFTGKPVDGNVISGNLADGVLLDSGAAYNTLSGNFIGTDLAGTAALGNSGDGVAIANANNNSLIGTTFPQQPFVYLNLISGNLGNGLSILDSNNTTVQANCFGLGDDNATVVPNHLDGVLIEGTSANTQFGGVIPLGNISAGNLENGVEIKDTASGTVCFNTFCGLPAFIDTAVGNGGDGFLITSTGGSTLLRTNVIAGNHGNGVHISGNATGVQVAEDIIGMDTTGKLPLPNGGDGVLINGNANNNIIGGLQVSVITQNTISANGGDGIAIVGNASDNQIVHSFIGTNILGETAFGNTGAGIFIGGNAQNNTIGGTGVFQQNVISGNLGDGIELASSSTGTQVISNYIGSDRNGQLPVPNQGNGVQILNSSANQIGGTSSGDANVIAFNAKNGVVVNTGSSDGILENSIFGNTLSAISLVNGGNLNLASPIIGQAFQPTANTIRVTGVLLAAASTTYSIEIFASTNVGQGETFLGTVSVTTNATGVAAFTYNGALPKNADTYFTATATDPINNTSAFSTSLALGASGNNIAITSNPVGQSTGYGGTVQFTASATGLPAPTVQWQVSTDGGNTWSNLSDGGNYSGTQTTTLTVAGATVALNGDDYRAVFSNGLGESVTSAAQLLVKSSYAYDANFYAIGAYAYAYDAYATGGGSSTTFGMAYNAYVYSYYAYYYNAVGDTADSEYYASAAYNYAYWATYSAYIDYQNSGNVYSYYSYEYGTYSSLYSYYTAIGY